MTSPTVIADGMHARRPEFKDLIERALERELAARRGLRPHAQLAIPAHASPDAIEAAYQRLRRRYDSTEFSDYGPTAVAAAHEITELLRLAYERMRNGDRGGDEPRGARVRPDETCRALETLRGAIDRRLREAEAHRTAGRLQDAIRVFESVLVLDRRNAVAQQAVIELRAQLVPPPRPSAISRALGRLWRRSPPRPDGGAATERIGD